MNDNIFVVTNTLPISDSEKQIKLHRGDLIIVKRFNTKDHVVEIVFNGITYYPSIDVDVFCDHVVYLDPEHLEKIL